LEKQKQKVLIVTKGDRGVDLYVAGELYSIPPKKVVTGRDTIGAGDTFLASFTSQYLATQNPVGSAHFAMDHVSEFLLTKPMIAKTR
jgi:sugar/nucleoside kinase (ribokinase family)